MKALPPVDANTFVAALKPLLEKQDLQGLVGAVRARWKCDQIVELLTGDHEDAKKVALLSLAWVGDRCCVRPLLKQLKSDDEVIYGMAEHALWSIFFRSGTPAANHEVCKGSKLLDAGRFEEAIGHFTRAIELDPTFAEAFNQRAVAHYLNESYRKAVDDCDEAIERMPCHFGAWSGKGHCMIQMARLQDAADCYRKALEIHPHLDCVRETLAEIETKVKQIG